jgi:hypothetical protein
LSGIDEGIPICSKCVEKGFTIESPTYWVGEHPLGNIWLISNRFAKEYLQYKSYNVIFGRAFTISSEDFPEIKSFSCEYSTKDKRERIGVDKYLIIEKHYFIKGCKMFNTVMKSLEYYFEKNGGRYVG